MYNIRKTDLTQNRCCLFLVSFQEEVPLASSWQKVRLVIFRQKMCTVSRTLLMLRYPLFCPFPFFLLFLLRVFLFFLFTPSRENAKREGLSQTKSTKRQRRKVPSAAGIRRCAFCILFAFVSVLQAIVLSRRAFMGAAAATSEAPDHQAGGIRFTHRKDVTSTNQRRWQIKTTATGAGSSAAGATETAVPPFPPPPP
jgi:hypothetical protein